MHFSGHHSILIVSSSADDDDGDNDNDVENSEPKRKRMHPRCVQNVFATIHHHVNLHDFHLHYCW